MAETADTLLFGVGVDGGFHVTYISVVHGVHDPLLGAARPRRHDFAPECPELAAAPGCRLRPKPQTQLYLHFGLVFCVRGGVTLGVTVRRRRPGITACAPLLPLH